MTEPAQWADLVAHLRAQLAATHREGYEMARDAAAKRGLHLARYEVAMKQAKETE
jgi:hypothetical protein